MTRALVARGEAGDPRVVRRSILACAVRFAILVALMSAGPGGAAGADPPYAATFGAVALPRLGRGIHHQCRSADHQLRDRQLDERLGSGGGVDAEWSRIPTAGMSVALTFDCGGNDAGVPAILSALDHANVPATFFVTGRWAEIYPASTRAIAARYPVGNHTYSHPHLSQLADADVEGEIRQGASTLARMSGADAHPLFRFPYGESDARTIAVVNRLGYGGIRWTVDTLGWQGSTRDQSVDTVVARVVANLRPGAIVLMHVGAAEDGTTLDAAALTRVIAEVRARGYEFATLRDFFW